MSIAVPCAQKVKFDCNRFAKYYEINLTDGVKKSCTYVVIKLLVAYAYRYVHKCIGICYVHSNFLTLMQYILKRSVTSVTRYASGKKIE